MPSNCRFLIIFILLCVRYAAAVMTPTVEIREETPSKDSNRVRTNMRGEIEIIGLVGEPVVLECMPFNIDENAKVHWVWKSAKNNTVVEQINDGMRAKDTSRWKVTRGVASQNAIRLEIPTVSTSYAGTLQCQIDYIDNSQLIFKSRILLVYAEPRIIQYQSSFESTVNENENVTLRCNASGIPKPLIYWRRIGGSSSVIRNYGREVMGTSISFNKAQASDRGVYLCRAFNEMGSVSWSVKLIVQFKPIISIFTGTVTSEVLQKEGCDTQLSCSVTANPAPTKIVWGSDQVGEIRDDKQRLRIYEMAAADYTTYYTMSFEPTSSGDFKQYTCTAVNSVGTSSNSVVLKKSNVATPDQSGIVRCGSERRQPPSLLLLASLVLLFCQ